MHRYENTDANVKKLQLFLRRIVAVCCTIPALHRALLYRALHQRDFYCYRPRILAFLKILSGKVNKPDILYKVFCRFAEFVNSIYK
jgi:hypothetical protein